MQLAAALVELDRYLLRLVADDPVAALGLRAIDRKVGSMDQLASIRRITLSPWMPKALSDSVKGVLRSIEGCSKLRVFQSTLIANEVWKGLTARVG